jgi:DNA-binding Lrp family transcriptional regulator
MVVRATVFFREELRPGQGFGTKPLEQARKIPGVKNAFLTIGRFDGACLVEGANYADCSNAAVKINQIPGIRSTETLFEVVT